MSVFTLREEVIQAADCLSFTVEDTTGQYNATTNPTGYDAPNIDIADVTAAVIDVTKYGTSTTYSINASPTFPTLTAGTTVTIANTDLGLTATDVIPDGVYLIDYYITAIYVISATNSGASSITISYNATGVFGAGDSIEITSGPATILGTYTVVSSSYNGVSTTIIVSQAIVTTGSVGAQLQIIRHASQYELFFCNGRACLYDKLLAIESTDCLECSDAKVNFLAKINTFLMAARYAALCGKPNKATVILNYLSELCAMTDCTTCD